MTTESPDDGGGARPDHEGERRTNPQQATGQATTGTVPDQLRRRREASRRLSRLAHCGRDPWTADHRDWQDRHDVAMSKLGLAPEWQRARAVEAWERGVR
jgi:hypothetical protein